MLQTLYAKTPGETKLVTFAFGNVTAGPINTPVVAKSVLIGTDPGAALLSVGAAVISGTNVSVLVASGLNNCTYELLCTVNDISGQVHQDGATLTTITDAA